MKLSFEIDKITESIEFAKTNERFETIVSAVAKQDLKAVTKKNGWRFNGSKSLSNSKSRYINLRLKKSRA